MKIKRVAEMEAWDIVGIRQGRSNIAQRLASGSEKGLGLVFSGQSRLAATMTFL
jgi:hypothetical protein